MLQFQSFICRFSHFLWKIHDLNPKTLIEFAIYLLFLMTFLTFRKKSGAIHAEDDVMAQLEDVLAKQLKKGKGKRSNSHLKEFYQKMQMTNSNVKSILNLTQTFS